MRVAAIFEKLVQHGDFVSVAFRNGVTAYPRHQKFESSATIYQHILMEMGWIFLDAGTYTLSIESELDITAKIYTYKNGVAAGKIPADGAECVLPYTFTLDEPRELSIDFAVAGWDGSVALNIDDITEARVHNTASTETADRYESIALRPEEISDSDTIARAVNSKSNAAFIVLPSFELWGFCERSVTYVKILDLDKTGDKIIFSGRVSGVTDNLDSSGKMWQEIICVSALEYLEDTPSGGGDSGTALQTWLNTKLGNHNYDVSKDSRRKFTASVTGSYILRFNVSNPYTSIFEQIKNVLTNGNSLSTPSGTGTGYVAYQKALCFREAYSNGGNVLEVAADFGTAKDTAIIIGENLNELKIEKAIDDGIYTAVQAVSGVNSDYSRYSYTVENSERVAKYGVGRIKVVKAESIRCTSSCHEEYYTGVQWITRETQAYEDMKSEVQRYAAAEAAKLSDPPIKITLTAEDLATLGYTGYEEFELYNSYPVVCPAYGLNGQLMKITQIKRRLSDGRIEQITVERGEKLLTQSVGAKPMSEVVAKVETIETKIDDTTTVNAEIAETKAIEQNDGVTIRYMTPEEYEHAVLVPSTMYVVHTNDGNELYIGDSHISSGGGGGTLTYGAVLDDEEGTGWIPSATPVPVSFAGDTAVYYGQPNARCVIQGWRALFGSVTPEAADLMSRVTLTFLNGTSRTYEAFVSQVSWSGNRASMTVGVKIYENGSLISTIGGSGYYMGANTTQVGVYITCAGWTTQSGNLYPSNVKIYGASSADGGAVRAHTSSIDVPTPTVTEAERGFGIALTSRAEPS